MQRKILIVESHEDTRELYAEHLRFCGFKVLAARTADEGIANAPSVDAIVTGIAVHGSFDGLELIRRTRQNESTRRTPIIVLTAHAFEWHRQQAFDAGANAFLSKPCPLDLLVGEIRRQLALTATPDPQPVRAEPRPRRRTEVS